MKRVLIVLAVGVGIVVAAAAAWWYRAMTRNEAPEAVGCPLQKQTKYVQGQEEEITFFARAEEGSNERIARKALLIKRPGADTTVFIFHGFMCNKKDVRFLVASLFGSPIGDKPFNTITIDFRAHGDATVGQLCSFGRDEMLDVMGIVDYVRQHPELKNTRRIAYGFSMGAVASILAQAADPTLFELAVWDCPFDSTNNLIDRLLARLKFSFFGYEFSLPGSSLLRTFAYNEYVQSLIKAALKAIAHMDTRSINTRMVPIDVVEAMGKIEIPLFLIVCRNDEKAPVEAARSLFDATRGFKRLWITNGRNHFDSYFYNTEKYVYKVRKFIDHVMQGLHATKKQAHIMEDVPEASFQKGE